MSTVPSNPKVVAIGGGHGLAATLRALLGHAGEITAVVSVADDGGSSGRLREAFGIPAPGDLRRCLVALGDPTLAWAGFFEHRFDAGELEGHALGNLVIAAMTSATGDFIAALDEAGRLVGSRGRVLPASTVPVTLRAEAAGGSIEGQVRVSSAGSISTVSLVPGDAPAPDEALAAIAGADQVVLGPGSLFTSVLAAALVPGIRAALAATSATTVYVCNLHPQVPETEGFDVAAHVAALARHGVYPDVVVCQPGSVPGDHLDPMGPIFVERDVAAPSGLVHDPVRLGAVLAELAEPPGGSGRAPVPARRLRFGDMGPGGSSAAGSRRSATARTTRAPGRPPEGMEERT